MKRFFIAMLAAASINGLCMGEGREAFGPEAPPLPTTNGMIRSGLMQRGSRWEVNGKDVTEAKGRGALAGDDQVPDDSKAPSLTFIGGKIETSKARDDLEKSPATAELVKRYLVQEFEPSNPLIQRAGFLTKGKPTIYAEMPDGRTLFRVDEYPGAAAMVATLTAALQVAEGVRKPDPAYNPLADTGLAVPIKPQVNADVQLGPWATALSHAIAFVVGMLGGAGAAGGGYVVLRKLLAAVIAAELGKVAPPASASPTAVPKA